MDLPGKRILSAVVLIAIFPAFPLVRAAEPVVVKVVMVQNEDPTQAGKAAAAQLRAAMRGVPLHAVFVSECFEDRESKSALLAGVCSELPKDIVYGGATYGSFTQEACTDFGAVCLVGFGGPGLQVAAELVTDLGTSKLTMDTDKELIAARLHKAGADLASRFTRSERDRLLVLFADCALAQEPVSGRRRAARLGDGLPHHRRLREQKRRTDVCLLPRRNVRGQCLGAAVERRLSGIPVGPASERQRAGDQYGSGRGSGGPDGGRRQAAGGSGLQLRRATQQTEEVRRRTGRDPGRTGARVASFRLLLRGRNGPGRRCRIARKARCGGSGWHVMFTVLSRE